ncbi:MAG: (d)CMP kinase [Gemmatimonadales bacterium]
MSRHPPPATGHLSLATPDPRPVTESRVIAIDGPSASGKSSTAAAVAQALGVPHLDSGALYRGLALVALESAVATRTTAAAVPHTEILAAAERRRLELLLDQASFGVWLDGVDAEPRIRTPEVTGAVSPVSAIPALRDWVNVRLQEAALGAGSVVVDGRDIGTVVFPDAGLKVFLTASPQTRARRRSAQWGRPMDEVALAREAAALEARDLADSTRAVAPLRQAADALPLDTTGLDFEQQVAWIVARARERGFAQTP